MVKVAAKKAAHKRKTNGDTLTHRRARCQECKTVTQCTFYMGPMCAQCWWRQS